MKVIHVDTRENVGEIDKAVNQGKHVFLLIYMEGCGPCNATRPEWEKLESALEEQYKKNDKLVIIDVNKDFLSDVKSVKDVDGFPTMKYIANKGATVESYEDSGVKNKDRSIDSFINWVESKVTNTVSTVDTSSPEKVYKRLTSEQEGGKRSTVKRSTVKRSQKIRSRRRRHWSAKYKRSINCSRPKCFSQKQYCKYGRNK